MRKISARLLSLCALWLAAQQPAAEGMAKLSSIFASVIEPITTGSGT